MNKIFCSTTLGDVYRHYTSNVYFCVAVCKSDISTFYVVYSVSEVKVNVITRI